MKRFLGLSLLTVCLATSAFAADEVKLKLEDGKIKPAEGVGSDLAGYDEGESRIFFYAPAGAEWKFKVEKAGEYTLVVRASCDAAQDENAKFKLTINGKEDEKDTTLKSADQEDITLTVKLKEGENTLGLTFTNDAYKEGEYDRNLYLHGLTIKPKAKE